MKRLMLTGLLIGCGIFGAEAQKIYKDGTMFVIECAGMPVGVYTKEAKPRTTEGTNTTECSQAATDIGSRVNNLQVAYKFEVAATNNSNGESWLTAVNLCAGLTGGNWRLPTHREMELMYLQQDKLESLPGFTLFNNSPAYWSGSGYVANESISMTFSIGNKLLSSKTYSFGVRCIRDL